MSPIRLTDDELSAVFTAAQPIPVARRDQFLQDVATLLRRSPEVGQARCIVRLRRPNEPTSIRPSWSLARSPAAENMARPRSPGSL
jgi:hypothetical protein